MDAETGDHLLSKAIEGQRQVLQVYQREYQPQPWATALTTLGESLVEQGRRQGGEEGALSLAEAVEVLQRALEVRTRDHLPQPWAMTQHHLGAALAAQGAQAGGQTGRQLLGNAVEAYQRALEVRTREHLPGPWAETHQQLAEAYVALGDWPSAATSYANVLQVYPDDERAYKSASSLYHERLFEFPQAFALHQGWLERHPEDLSALSDLAETHLTAGRSATCEERIADLLAKSAIESGLNIRLRAIEIACLLALDDTAPIPGKIDTLLGLITDQPEDFRVGMTFNGTKYFISHNEQLAPYRPWLLQFYSAMESKDRHTLLVALQAARANIHAAVKQ